MFTGIIESLGRVESIHYQGNNFIYSINSPTSKDLTIDQRVSHNGVCLTVVEIKDDSHTVVAISETLDKTNLKLWKAGSIINLERAMLAGARLDGHMVQGHVDCVAKCVSIEDQNGSWLFTIQLNDLSNQNLLVQKGSVCIDGVSLTLVNPIDDLFSVAIIPYTFENTNFNNLKVEDLVNIEFDIIGKYIQRQLAPYLDALKK
ncbi:MAG: riboflavin synthase [Saprospiraceae bacterium]|nr:riboflavin synthase [Saprospiraceae bacterium]